MRRDENFTVGAHAHLDANIAAGTVEVSAADVNVVRVSIDAKTTDGFEIAQIGDTITIREESQWRARNRRVRVVVEVPPDSDLTLHTASADVAIRGRMGIVKARAASGDVDIDHAARLEVNTASGDIRVGSVAGDAAFNTASGGVEVRTAGGQLDASTASGDVSAHSVAHAVDIGTASGDVELDRCEGDDIYVKTLSGNIRIGLPTGIRVEPDITTMSGRVTLPAPADTEQSIVRRVVRLRMKSMSGNIRIDRAD